MKKFLVIQTAFLGDAILTVPIIDSLKNKFQDDNIYVLTTPQNKDVYTLNHNIYDIILYDKHNLENDIFSMIRKIKFLKSIGFDYIVTPHPSARTALISYLSSAKVRIAPSSVSLSFLYTHTVNVSSYQHQIDKNLALLKTLGFDEKDLIRKINLFFTKEDEKLINGVLEAYSVDHNKKIIVINPLSAWLTKRWPKEYYKELASMLVQSGHLVILIGTKKDIGIGEYIKNNKKNVVNLMGQTNLKELFAVISKAHLLISNDSAPVHIASAYDVATIEIYGPTLPEFAISTLKNVKFDAIYDLQVNLKSAILSFKLKGKVYRAPKHRLYRLKVLYKSRFPFNFVKDKKQKDIIEDYLSLIGKNDGLTKLVCNKKEKNDSLIIGLAPFAAWKNKMWPTENFIKLLERLDSQFHPLFYIFGSKEEKSLANHFNNLKLKIMNYVGNLLIHQTVEKISQCDIFITNDSALMHIASACGVPIVAIFGPTVRKFGFYPRTKSIIVEKQLYCRPCHLHGGNTCKKGDFECMKSISVDDVFHAVKLLLEEKNA